MRSPALIAVAPASRVSSVNNTEPPVLYIGKTTDTRASPTMAFALGSIIGVTAQGIVVFVVVFILVFSWVCVTLAPLGMTPSAGRLSRAVRARHFSPYLTDVGDKRRPNGFYQSHSCPSLNIQAVIA